MMKSTIDLTRDEMFSHPLTLARNVEDLIKVSDSKLPWNKELDDYFKSNSPEFQSVLTGNNKERKSKQSFLDMYLGIRCECCGISLHLIPWNKVYGLCNKCYDKLEHQCNKNSNYPWTFNNLDKEIDVLYW